MYQLTPYAKDIISRYRRVEPWWNSININFADFATAFARLDTIEMLECTDDVLITEIGVDFLNPLVKVSIWDKSMYHWDQNNPPVPIHAIAGSIAEACPVSTIPIEYFLPARDSLFFAFRQGGEVVTTTNQTLLCRGIRLKEKIKKDRNPDRESKNIENGRWVPSIDVINVGSFETTANSQAVLILDTTYKVFTQPKPFDWYIFGFAANWSINFIVDTFLDVANLSLRENLTSRFLTGGGFLGVPTNITAGWMPLQVAHHEVGGVHKAWAWADLNTENYEIGARFWLDKEKSLQFIAPYMLPKGKQLRFILQNHCAQDFIDTKLSVIGQRWLPWDAERIPE